MVVEILYRNVQFNSKIHAIAKLLTQCLCFEILCRHPDGVLITT